jgi:hypothetical protein
VFPFGGHHREAPELLHVQNTGTGPGPLPRSPAVRAARFVALGRQGAVTCRIQSANRTRSESQCSSRRDSIRKEGRCSYGSVCVDSGRVLGRINCAGSTSPTA